MYQVSNRVKSVAEASRVQAPSIMVNVNASVMYTRHRHIVVCYCLSNNHRHSMQKKNKLIKRLLPHIIWAPTTSKGNLCSESPWQRTLIIARFKLWQIDHNSLAYLAKSSYTIQPTIWQVRTVQLSVQSAFGQLAWRQINSGKLSE